MSQPRTLHDVEVANVRPGVRLVHIKSNLPIATISLWFDYGSRNDPRGKEGMAHFTEHLFMKTTPAFPTVNALQAFQAANGIRYNATTFASTVRFYYETMIDNVFFALDHFLDTVRNSYIREDLFLSEKSVIEDERARRSRESNRTMYNLVRAALFPQGRLAHPGLGTEVSVRGITYADAASFVEDFATRGPKTFVITSPNTLAEFLPYFNDFPAAEGSAIVGFEKDFGEPERLAVLKNDSRSVMVSLNYRVCGEGDDADICALQCLARAYLCGSKGSRLFERLRLDRHLTYSVSGVVEHFQEVGSFSIRYSVPKEHLRASIEICEDEIGKIRRGEIDLMRLSAAKKGLQLALAEQCLDPMSVAGWYASQRRTGEFTRTYEAFLERVERLAPEDLIRVAKAYFRAERRSIALIGDVSEEDVVGL